MTLEQLGHHRNRQPLIAFLVDADEKRFDQQSVVENDGCRGGHLLIGQVVVLDAGEAGFVAVAEHPLELVACGPDAAGATSAASPRSMIPTSPPCSIPHRCRNSAGKFV
jgi:hypothetical protein